ncbi:MAG TPA: pyridoxal phosphate-dependent aminotransferase [Gammaproteobacteria bacterium]|nr:pyridoxal phosphate-dependent aminotransferase [Gammaproteobacteria bacterium]
MSQARRMAHIQPFHVMALLARARALEAQGHDIVHMEIGEPDFPTPAPIVAAGQRALAAGLTHYTPALGLPELRAAISDFYRDHHGVAVDPGRIVITPGASGALHLVLALLVDRDQQVLLTDPGYPCNRNFVHLVEGEPVGVPVDAATGYQLTAAMAEQHWTERTRVLMVASPANPTGTLLSQAELAALAQLARARGARLVVDEIYHGLTYDSDAPTALAVSDELFVINSFSKYFGMTGWRLGWIVAPPDQVEGLERLAQNLYLAAPTLSQHAALAAFTPETRAILEERRAAFQARRDYLLPALRELGFVIPVTPQGAFYLYADCSRFTDDSFAFSRQLLEEAGVAITPGLDFGEHRASQHVRFAYTTDIPRLQEGVERIRRFVV